MTLGQRLNGDDSPALGSSYYSAGLSAGFKIKRVDVKHYYDYEFTYKVKDNEDKILEEGILF
jgi:predicted solute-binding protein